MEIIKVNNMFKGLRFKPKNKKYYLFKLKKESYFLLDTFFCRHPLFINLYDTNKNCKDTYLMSPNSLGLFKAKYVIESFEPIDITKFKKEFLD